MNEQFRLSRAQIIGRGHLLSGRNSQDAAVSSMVEASGRINYYGVICDGCSEGTDSEVGAKLAASFIARQIEILLKSDVPVQKIPPILFRRVQMFLKKILGKISFDSQISRIDYIKNNLLFTVIAFICAEETLIFALGDGVIMVDDKVVVRDENDAPNYIGYNLIDRKYLIPGASTLPHDFDVLVIPSGNFKRLGIASDSLGMELSVVSALWGNEKPMSLQKKVNVWSLVEHKFKDDLSIILLEETGSGQGG